MTEKEFKKKLTELIEKHGVNTSEDSIYWDLGALEALVDELYELYKGELK